MLNEPEFLSRQKTFRSNHFKLSFAHM